MEESILELRDVVRPGSTRGLDFVILDELRKRTGVSPDSVPKFALSEMLCNALDKDSTEIGVDIQVDGDSYRLEVRDNGSKKLSLEELELILDFENKASSKRGFLRVSRGYLGNALKCIFGYSYALAESRGLVPPCIIVASTGYEHRINLKPDRVKEVIRSEIETRKIEDDGFTTFTVRFPKDDGTHEPRQSPHPSNPSVLRDLISSTSMVNPTRQIHYSLFDIEKGVLGSMEAAKAIKQETSVLWYTEKQFQSLFEDYLRARPQTQLKEFIPLFKGFSSKKTIGEILQKLNPGNHDSGGSGAVQFFPATPIRDLSRRMVQELFVVMRLKAKPITKRSISSVLGFVGEEAFEKLRRQNGWERLRYVMMPGVKVDCPEPYHGDGACGNPDHTEFPYLIEVGVFDRKRGDVDGLKVYQCVNFSASMEDIFGKIYDVHYHLGRVGISGETPVTVAVHFVCPVLKWLNYGKSALDE